MALRSFRDESLREIEGWTAALSEDKFTPEEALDRLYAARTRLAGLLQEHAATVINGYAKDTREAQLMRKEMFSSDGQRGHGRRRTYEPSILGAVYPSYQFFSVATFSSGLDSGVSSVSAARGGEGGTAGYGSTGGSFSGSGSSSGF